MTRSEWTLDTYMAHMEVVLGERDKALAIQAREYERRLDNLNHAHERQAETQRTYVRQEKFDDYAKQANDAITARDLRYDDRWGREHARLDSLEKWQAKVIGMVAAGTFLGGALGAAIIKLVGG